MASSHPRRRDQPDPAACSQGTAVPRERDILPVRGPASLTLPEVKAVSRCVRRRLEARGHASAWAAEAAACLNELGGVAEPPFPQKGLLERSLVTDAPAVRAKAEQHIINSVQSWGKPPADLSGRGAYQELQANHAYTGEPVHVAALDISLLSLAGAGDAKPLDSLLRGGDVEVESFVTNFLLPKEQAAEHLRMTGVPRRPHLDPSLRNPRQYEKLIMLMYEKGMVEWSGCVQELCGLFTVWKASGKQRLIIDARRSNQWFRAPPKTRLATGDSFARLRAVGSCALELGQTDIQDAFYQMQMPVALRPLFGLPRVRAGRVGAEVTVEGKTLQENSWVFPRLTVLAMGWTHALHWCQRVLEEAALRAPSLTTGAQIIDRKPAPEIGSKNGEVCHAEYVDNFVAFSQGSGQAAVSATEVRQELERAGLRSHEVVAGPGGEAHRVELRCGFGLAISKTAASVEDPISH